MCPSFHLQLVVPLLLSVTDVALLDVLALQVIVNSNRPFVCVSSMMSLPRLPFVAFLVRSSLSLALVTHSLPFVVQVSTGPLGVFSIVQMLFFSPPNSLTMA